MKTVCGYVRVSSHEQEEYSPDSQIKLLREYAKRNDMVLPEELIFRDDGISGRSAEKRPEFMRMIGMAKQKPKPFDAILVWKYSRFARNQEESIVYKSLLGRENNIGVISVSEPLADGPFGSLIERIIEWMDQFYSIRLSGEVRRGMTERVSRGLPVSVPAFGYSIVDKMYVINPDAAPLVVKVFDDYLSGIGCREIAERLNAMEIRTTRGGAWENRTVEYILRNPVYIGKLRWNAERRTQRNYDDPAIMIVDGHHEPIISPEVFESVQAKLLNNKAVYGRYNRSDSPIEYLLHGVVKCSSCGATLTRANGTGLQCHNYARGKCLVSHSVTIPRLTQMVMDSLQMVYDGIIPAVYAEPVLPEGDNSELIAAEKRKLERLKAAYTAGIDTIEEYRDSKAKVAERIRLLQAIVPPHSRKPIRERLSVTAQLSNQALTEQERNRLLRTVVHHVVFDRESCSGDIFLSR